MNSTEVNSSVSDGDKPLDSSYWNKKYEKNELGWDLGAPSIPIITFFQNIEDKDISILIPGCGNAYEAVFLAEHGFTNISVIDIAPIAVENLSKKFINYPQIKIYCEDFFEHQGKYDVIIEQTFFCAINPTKRKDYVQKVNALLLDEGKVVGVLFDKTFEKQGPPFGGNTLEYKTLFQPYFIIHKMEHCYNSMPSRINDEVFIHLIKKT